MALGRRRGMSKYNDKRSPATFKIQITSMVDMFVILLVFLLKSYSTSPVNLNPHGDITLPASTSTKDPVDALKLVVSRGGIFVEDEKVVEMTNGVLQISDVEASDTQFISKLYKALDTHAQKSRMIASQNTELEFDGKVVMQADRDLPYDLLRKVMYTSMLAGYSDVKLAVMLAE